MKKQTKKTLISAFASLGLFACQGEQVDTKGSIKKTAENGAYESCMISAAKNNAADAYSTMCFNIPAQSSANLCSEGAFGVNSGVTETEAQGSDVSGEQDSNNQAQTDQTLENTVESNANVSIPGNKGSMLNLADSGSAPLKFRLNANVCQIIKPIAKACETNIDGVSNKIYFSSFDVSEQEAASLCSGLLNGALVDVDLNSINNTTPDNTDPNNTDPNKNDPVNPDPNNTDPNNSVATGLAASLSAKIKDCGDSATDDIYCHKGKLGNGPRFTSNNPGSEIQHGFVDAANKRLIVVTGPHMDESGLLPDGMSYSPSIMSVNLETGDRSVISGVKLDMANGNEVIGSGPIVSEYFNVIDGGDGRFYVKAKTGELLSVDPSTGDRVLVKQFPDPITTTPVTACARAYQATAFTLDKKGNYFFPYKVPGGAGIVKFDSKADQCTYLTTTGDPDAGNFGSGPAVADRMVNIEYRDGFLYGNVFLGQMVVKVSAEGENAGKRSIISSVERDVGSGARCHASEGFTMTDNLIYLAESSSGCPYGPSVIKVTMEGERSAPEPGVGWENPPAEIQRLYAIPGADEVVLGATQDNIVIIDWTKKKASFLSNNK